MDGLSDFINLTWLVLSFDASLLDEFHVWLGRPVSNGGFVGIHLDDGIINSHTAKSGQNMLDRVDLDRAFCQCGGTLDSLYLGNIRIDKWLIVQIYASEFEPVSCGGRLQRQADFFSGVEGGSLQRSA